MVGRPLQASPNPSIVAIKKDADGEVKSEIDMKKIFSCPMTMGVPLYRALTTNRGPAMTTRTGGQGVHYRSAERVRGRSATLLQKKKLGIKEET